MTETGDPCSAALAAVEEALWKSTDLHPPVAQTITRYLLQAGGKRIRPAVFLQWSALWGPCTPTHIQVAAYIELLHTATLFHDDVVDTSPARRGIPSAYQQYGARASVATGDWIFSQVFNALLSIQEGALMPAFTWGMNALSRGELIQWAYQGINTPLTETHYWDVITGKTARLFETMLWMATILSVPATHPQYETAIRQSRELGIALGLLFQVGDDVGDYAGTLGKQPGDDLREGKITLPLIYGIQADPLNAPTQIQAGFQDPQQHLSTTIAWLHACGAWTQLAQTGHQLGERCLACLTDFPPSQSRDQLCQLIEQWVARTIFPRSSPTIR